MIKPILVVKVDGKMVYEGESKSLLQNFAKALLTILSSPGSGVTTSTSIGATVNFFGEWYAGTYYGGGVHLAMNALSGDDSFGIVVGSGTTNVSPTDSSLASKISNGTGSGQLSYQTHTTNSSFSSSSSFIQISRTFINNSGADVVVREVGLIARNFFRDNSGVKNDAKILIARDVLPNPVTVKPLGSLNVTYTLSLSVS